MPADFLFKDAFISVSGYVLNADTLSIEDGNESIANTKMGHTAPSVAPGLPQQKIVATFKVNYGSGSVHQALKAARDATKAGSSVTVVVRPDSGAKSASNPEWSGPMVLMKYDPIPNVSAGQLGTVTVTFDTCGTALTYSESA